MAPLGATFNGVFGGGALRRYFRRAFKKVLEGGAALSYGLSLKNIDCYPLCIEDS